MWSEITSPLPHFNQPLISHVKMHVLKVAVAIVTCDVFEIAVDAQTVPMAINVKHLHLLHLS